MVAESLRLHWQPCVSSAVTPWFRWGLWRVELCRHCWHCWPLHAHCKSKRRCVNLHTVKVKKVFSIFFLCLISCLSGSFCFSIPATSFPICTASLPVTWRAPSPLGIIQGRWRWSSAYTHCHHIVWHDNWEGTNNTFQYLNVMFK